LNGIVDLACVKCAAAVSIGGEERVGELFKHLVQGNVLVEVNRFGVVTAERVKLASTNSKRLTKKKLTDRRP